MFPSAIRYRRTAQRWRVGSGRLSEPATGRVVVALCSANRHPDGDWSTAAIALHPGGVVREAALDGVVASRSRFAVIAGTPAGRVSASKDHLAMAIGDAELDLRFTDTRLWPKALGGGGVFSSVPFLNQYWQPYRLGGMASGTVTCGGERWDFTDATLYCERNWGAGFPLRWWTTGWPPVGSFHPAMPSRSARTRNAEAKGFSAVSTRI